MKRTSFMNLLFVLRSYFVLLGIPLFLTPCIVNAQKGNIRFEHLSSENGLSQNSVQCIVQDSKGFMWFGTYEGLNRFDGYEFKVYKSDIGNPNSLCNNTVQFLYEDHNGNLWIGTDGGLDRYNEQIDEFIHYKNNPKDSCSLSNNRIRWIGEDQSGTLWIGTYGGGLNQFDGNKRFIRYQNNPIDPNSIIGNNVTYVCIEKSGILWIATDAGITRFDRERNRFIRYQHDPGNSKSVSGNDAYRIYEDRAGVLWFGIWNGGLDRFDRKKEQFIHYRYRSNDPYSLSNDIVRAFYEDQTGRLWIGTWGGGINIYDRTNDRFIRYESDPNDMYSISNNSVLTIYEDRSGIVWIGNDYGGVNKFDRGKLKFNHYKKDPKNPHALSSNTIFSIAETNDKGKKILWFGTHAGGLNKYDREKNIFTHYMSDPYNPHSLIDDNVRAIIVDRRGGLWIGTNKGLNFFDRTKETFTYYIPHPNIFGLTNNDVFSLYEDKSGYIWVGLYGRGLYKFDPKKKIFTNYFSDPNDPGSISDNYIWSIFEDHTGVLWIGTENGGLNQFDRASNSFIRYEADFKNPNSLSDNKILCIFEDKSGTMWFGTTIGLNKFDRNNKCFSHYLEADGLPSNAIQSILEDDHGNLWIGTQKGLSKFNPRTNKFTNFKVSDGLQSNEFSVNACLKSSNGEMFFGGNNGFNTFLPDSIRNNPYVPSVVVTNFQIFNKSVPIGKEIDGHVILKKSILETDEIDLSYKENNFLFEFASLHLASPEENKYAYMMVGLDSTWNYTGAKRRFASYTNMSGGNYIFRVKGTNSDGIWNETGASIRIKITPPFWKTLWFYVVSGIVLISVIAGVYRYRIYSVRANERYLQIKVDERTRELSREVNEHRKAEEALFIQNTAVQSVANAIIITDRDGKIIAVNQAFMKITGYPPEEAIGQKTSILKSGNQPVSFYQKLWETILSGEVWKGEIENRRKDGSLYTEEMTITPVRQAGGNISHFIAIKQDVTEQKKLQNQLLQVQKNESIGTLAGGIAHDFNNILGIILAYTSSIERSQGDARKLYIATETITKAVQRGKTLVQQILTFARKTETSFGPVNVNDVVMELIPMLFETFPKILTYSQNFDKDIPFINADRSQLHQVLLNLCVNARDAMPSGGMLTINTRMVSVASLHFQHPEAAASSYVCIELIDTGEGMSEEIRKHIFEPFYTTKGIGKGTGLGLSVVFSCSKS